jgi:hypothetical protein
VAYAKCVEHNDYWSMCERDNTLEGKWLWEKCDEDSPCVTGASCVGDIHHKMCLDNESLSIYSNDTHAIETESYSNLLLI